MTGGMLKIHGRCPVCLHWHSKTLVNWYGFCGPCFAQCLKAADDSGCDQTMYLLGVWQYYDEYYNRPGFVPQKRKKKRGKHRAN